MDFFSALSLDAPRAHLLVKGEFDAFTALQVGQRLDEAVDHGCITFTVDASAVTFVDAGALGTLVGLSNTVAPFGGTLEVVAASPRFCQVADLVGLSEAFGLDLLPDTPPSPRHAVSAGGMRGTAHRLSVAPPARITLPSPPAAGPVGHGSSRRAAL